MAGRTLRCPLFSGFIFSVNQFTLLTTIPKDKINGQIIEALPDTKFKVKLEDGREVLVYLAGKMRLHYIKVMIGDRVAVELSPDGTRGRIVYRY